MRLRKTTLSSLVSFLLGAGWGMALIGALWMFFSVLPVSIFAALLSAVLGMIPGLVLVVFLEYLLLKSEMLAEMKRQTKLLENLTQRLPTP